MATASEKPTEIALKSSQEATELVAKETWGFPPSIVAATWAQYPELTRNELGRFLFEASRLGLDPATGRQLFAILYNKEKPNRTLSIQIGVAGFRLVAARTGEMNGSADVEDGPEVTTDYKSDNGTIVTIKHPAFCRAQVWRKGSEHPFVARVRWEERVKLGYGRLPTEFWRDQPYGMLEKAAETAALRKAFPMETRGLVLEGENPDPFPDAIDTVAAPAPSPESVINVPAPTGPVFIPSPLSVTPAPPPVDDLEPLRAEIRAAMNASDSTSLGL